MTPFTYISPRTVIGSLVRRYPCAADILSASGIDASNNHLSIELAAEAHQRDARSLLNGLRSSLAAAPCPA